MPGIGRSLYIGLKADVRDFERGMRGAGKTVDRFKSRLKYAAIAGAGSMAALGVAAVKAAADDEAAQVQLAKALKNTVKASDGLIASTEEWITKQQYATGISDTDFRKGLARLTRSTKDVAEAQRLSTLATDIAAGTGKDYGTVVQALAKANDGQFNALKKLGITMGDNSKNAATLVAEQKKLAKFQDEANYALEEYGPKSEEYAKATDKVIEQQTKVNAVQEEGADWVGELTKEFSGSASAAAETYAGKVKILRERWQEFLEGAGAALMPWAERAVTALSNVAKGFQDGAGGGIAEHVGAASDALEEAREKNFPDDWQKLGDAIKRVVGFIKDNMTIVKMFVGAWAAFWVTGKISGAVTAITTALSVIRAAMIKTTAVSATAAMAEASATGGASLLAAMPAMAALATFFGVAMLQYAGALKGPKVAPETRFKGATNSKTKVSSVIGGNTPKSFLSSGATSMGSTMPATTQVVNITMNGVIDGESARRSIENVIQKSARRTGAVNWSGAAL